jgi:hypothetical protein
VGGEWKGQICREEKKWHVLPSSNETKALCARVCPGGWLFNVRFCLIPGDKGYLMSSVSCGMRPADSGTCRLHMPVPLEIDGDFNFDALVTADYNPEHAVVMECAEPISLSQEDLTALSQLTEAGYVLHYDSTLGGLVALTAALSTCRTP